MQYLIALPLTQEEHLPEKEEKKWWKWVLQIKNMYIFRRKINLTFFSRSWLLVKKAHKVTVVKAWVFSKTMLRVTVWFPVSAWTFPGIPSGLPCRFLLQIYLGLLQKFSKGLLQALLHRFLEEFLHEFMPGLLYEFQLEFFQQCRRGSSWNSSWD